MGDSPIIFFDFMLGHLNHRFSDIVSDGVERKVLTREDCAYLLSYGEDTPESEFLIRSAKNFVLSRTEGVGEIGSQIGIHIGPCIADCAFCSFACSNAFFEDFKMGENELRGYLERIVSEKTVTSVSLMTIHDFDFDLLLERVGFARDILPKGVRLVVNCGDLEDWQCRKLRSAGADWAYHALRLREGIDNSLEPYQRYITIKNLKDSGIRVASGVEPIGPEHSIEEIVDGFWKALEMGCDCCSASRRESVYGSRAWGRGDISPGRLSQIRSALMLCTSSLDRTPLGFYGGVYGGLGKVLTEYSSSPKDLEDRSELGLSRTVEWGRRLLKSEGFSKVRCADGSIVDLM